MGRASQLRKGLFSLVMALSLGFGATQALAVPAPPEATARTCDLWKCFQTCQSFGYMYGECANDRCYCFSD